MRSIDDGRYTSGEPARVCARRARGRSTGRVLGSLSLLALATTLGACEGDNLFAGDSPELLPRVMGLTAPNTAVAGDTISVRVDAYAPHGVAQIVVSLEGAVSRDTIVDVLPVRSQVSQNVRVPVPSVLTDTLLTVRASITDVLGNTSLGRTTEIVAYGPPAVTSISGPASVRAGEVVNLEVKVAGARRVSRVDYQIRGALSKDTSIVVAPAARTVTQTLLLQVPFVAQDTVLAVNVSARDESGYSSAPQQKLIPLSIDPPVLTLTLPSEVRAGDKLEVKVGATGLRKVSQIRISLRDAVVDEVVVPVDPQMSDFLQTVSIQLPGAIMCAVPLCTSRDLAVHVFALDIGGAISVTKSDTVNVPLGPPTVADVRAPGSTYDNQTVDVYVDLTGVRPLSRFEVSWRGAVDATQSYAISGQRYEALNQHVFVQVPAAPKDEVLIVTVQAFDVAGEASAPSQSVVIPVTVDTTSGSLSTTEAARPGAPPRRDASVSHTTFGGAQPVALLAYRERALTARRDWRAATR